MMLEKICIIASQLATCITSWWMFHSVLKKSAEKTWLTFVGMAIYVLLPFHVNIVLKNRSWIQIMIWMLVPFLVTMLLYMKKTADWRGQLIYGALAAAGMGIIGRKDGVAYLILLFLITIAGVCEKQWRYPLAGIAGMLLAYPTFYVWKYWLFDGAFAESGLEYASIMERGYSVGGLFSTYFHRNGNPGMGILLLGCLLFLLYQSFVKGKKITVRNDVIRLGIAALLTLMSLRYFPWDFVQRLGVWALGLVTLIRTPAVFFGYAQIILCVWSVEKCNMIMQAAREERNEENKEKNICKVEENTQDMAG